MMWNISTISLCAKMKDQTKRDWSAFIHPVSFPHTKIYFYKFNYAIFFLFTTTSAPAHASTIIAIPATPLSAVFGDVPAAVLELVATYWSLEPSVEPGVVVFPLEAVAVRTITMLEKEVNFAVTVPFAAVASSTYQLPSACLWKMHTLSPAFTEALNVTVTGCSQKRHLHDSCLHP